MVKKSFRFSTATVDYHFSGSLTQLKNIVDQKSAVIITDENIYSQHEKRFRNWNCIVLKPGEAYKVQATVDSIIAQLIEMGADRKFFLIGVGGGVITDITGYVASVYMRGIRFGFVPTTILGLVDASIGGKNGIDVDVYKNMVGVIRQPAFILHDLNFLQTLPESEWQNGFAEIIKHACIKDLTMFEELEKRTPDWYRRKKTALADLVQRNALLKTKVVQKDEFETGGRKLLNFGHTLGHALETQYELSHGQAISIGMTYACHISEQLSRFKETARVTETLGRYGLPTYAEFDRARAFQILKKDKKQAGGSMSYVLLRKIGKGIVHAIPMPELERIIQSL